MFEFLWKTKDAAKLAEQSGKLSSAHGTQLHYDPNLVPQLVADHQMLLGIFGDLVAAMKRKDMGLVKEKLGKFGDELNGHLLKENIRFYIYLQHSLKTDPESTSIVHGFRKEMQHIGKAVMDFLHKYTAKGDWNEATWQNFQQEVGDIGKVLTKRIQTEESTLYPLYLPPQDYL